MPGMCGVVEDGILPGYPGFEAGQSCVGDHFEWFVENCVPAAYREEAKAGVLAYISCLPKRLKLSKLVKAASWRWTGGTATVLCWWTWTSPACSSAARC